MAVSHAKASWVSGMPETATDERHFDVTPQLVDSFPHCAHCSDGVMPLFSLRRFSHNFDQLSAKRNREAVPERKLKTKVAERESVREVIAARPLEFAAHHHILHRSREEISDRVLAGLEGARSLSVAVGDIDP